MPRSPCPNCSVPLLALMVGVLVAAALDDDDIESPPQAAMNTASEAATPPPPAWRRNRLRDVASSASSRTALGASAIGTAPSGCVGPLTRHPPHADDLLARRPCDPFPRLPRRP